MMPALAVIWLGSPVITLFTCLIIIFNRRPAAFTFTKIWAAFYAAFVLIACATFQSDGSLGAVVAQLLLIICASLLFVMLVVIAIKNERHRMTPSGLSSPWLLRDTFCAIIGGWVTGIIFWSFTSPPVIISSAEKIAAGAPYCITAYWGPARSLLDLTALRFFRPSYSLRHAYGFHGTLSVLEAADGEIVYKNLYYWSYRKKTFLPYAHFVYDTTKSDSCIADKQFAKKLSIF